MTTTFSRRNGAGSTGSIGSAGSIGFIATVLLALVSSTVLCAVTPAQAAGDAPCALLQARPA